MLYMVTFTINIPHMLAYIPYMDPMGMFLCCLGASFQVRKAAWLEFRRRSLWVLLRFR